MKLAKIIMLWNFGICLGSFFISRWSTGENLEDDILIFCIPGMVLVSFSIWVAQRMGKKPFVGGIVGVVIWLLLIVGHDGLLAYLLKNSGV